MVSKHDLVLRVAAACLALLVVSCGGGGSSGVSTPPNPPPAPRSLSYSSPDVYAVGTAIAPLTPSVSGTVTQYSVSPGLPSGLTLDPTSGEISGTPTAPLAKAAYTVTASNVSGSTSFSVSITIIAATTTPTQLSRMAVSGTSVAIALSVTPVNFSFAGTLTAQASDPAGVFAPTVSVAPDGAAFALSLATSSTVPPGHYTGTVTIDLCNGPPCATPQAVQSVSVPYDILILSPSSSWPGNNLTALVPWSGVPEWSTFQGNAAHTGYVPVKLDPNSFSTRWQIPAVDIPVSFSANLNTLVTENGLLFIGGGTTLYARKELDGSLVWQYDFSGLTDPSVNPPAVSNGVVYVAAGQQSSTYMFAFTASDGSLLFQSPMSSQWEHYLAPTVGPDGVYTNAGVYGGLYGFSFSGQQLFFAGSLPQVSMWTPAVDQSAVYAYTGDALRVLNPTTGAVQTTIVDPSYQNFIYQIDGSAVLGASGSVFAANYANATLNGGATGNELIDFNVPSASIAWEIAGDYPTTPAYDAGVLYVANNNPLRLEVRSATDGTLMWSWVPPQSADSAFVSEILLTENMVFVSTNAATYGIDLSTHKTVWSYPLSGKLALSPSGILYIEGQQSNTSPSVPGTLTAINVK